MKAFLQTKKFLFLYLLFSMAFISLLALSSDEDKVAQHLWPYATIYFLIAIASIFIRHKDKSKFFNNSFTIASFIMSLLVLFVVYIFYIEW